MYYYMSKRSFRNSRVKRAKHGYRKVSTFKRHFRKKTVKKRNYRKIYGGNDLTEPLIPFGIGMSTEVLKSLLDNGYIGEYVDNTFRKGYSYGNEVVELFKLVKSLKNFIAKGDFGFSESFESSMSVIESQLKEKKNTVKRLKDDFVKSLKIGDVLAFVNYQSMIKYVTIEATNGENYTIKLKSGRFGRNSKKVKKEWIKNNIAYKAQGGKLGAYLAKNQISA